MAIELTWDQVIDAEASEHAFEGLRIVRVGHITGLTTTTTTSSKALLDSLGRDASPLAAQLAFGSSHPNVPDAKLMYRVARGIPGPKGSMARVWAHYETPGGGGLPIEEFQIEDSGQLVAEPINIFPGTLKPLRCSTNATAPNYTLLEGPPASNRPITVNYPRNWRSIVMSGLFADRPPASLLRVGNTVNNATWQGRGIGYWRADPPDVRYSTRDGMYVVRAGVLSKGWEEGDDWSTYEIPRKPDGELAMPMEATLTALLAQPYEFGVRNDVNGVWKAGLYKTSNFGALFGVSLVGGGG